VPLARTILLALLTAAIFLVAASPAMAADGVGLWGRTDDKVITYFSLAVVVFFAAMVIVLSLIQIRLEGRKERERAELERLRRD
jgi:hypothetical protein